MALPEKRLPDAQAAQWQSRTRGEHFAIAHGLILGSLEQYHACASVRQSDRGGRATRTAADNGYVEQGMHVTSGGFRCLVQFRRIGRSLFL